GAEARFSIGERLHACNADAAVQCPDPINPTLSRDPGTSRAMNAYILNTVFSRRYGYIEPYMGFRFQVEVPQSNSDYAASNDFHVPLLTPPPLVGRVTMGMEIFPWEVRENFQRLGFDLKVNGTYNSPGRDYSELFDALGSSQARSLRNPNPSLYK